MAEKYRADAEKKRIKLRLAEAEFHLLDHAWAVTESAMFQRGVFRSSGPNLSRAIFPAVLSPGKRMNDRSDAFSSLGQSDQNLEWD
jgi:hypothetical protein